MKNTQDFTTISWQKRWWNHKPHFIPNILLVCTVIPLLVFTSCKKDPSAIGLDLHPASDKVTAAVIVSDGIRAYTFTEDSLTTDERSLALLGSYNDPVFGLSSASFVTQMRLLTFNVSFGNNAHADSMKIILDYQSYYGDTSMAQTFHLYELTQSIYPDSTYYSNLNPGSLTGTQAAIGTYTYQPHPKDTALVISLPQTFAQKFIDAPASVWADNTAFLSFFKGFCFVADTLTPGGSIVYFNLLSNKTKVILYFTNESTSSSYSFSINSNCARINLFKHNYTSSQITGLNDSLANPDQLFIQAMAGTGIRLYLPGLQTYRDSGTIVISKAELVIPVNDVYTTSNYPSPAKMLNVAFNDDKTYSFLPDYLSGEAYFGGTYNSSRKEYRFNIGRYVQQLIDGKREDLGIALLSGDNRVSAYRTVIKNTGIPEGIRLEMYYFKP